MEVAYPRMAQQVVLCSAVYFDIRGSSDRDQPASAEFQGGLCTFEVNPVDIKQIRNRVYFQGTVLTAQV